MKTTARLPHLRAAIGAAALALSGAAQANLLVNGSFELGTVTTAGYEYLNPGATAMSGWTVVADNLLWFHTSYTDSSGTLAASDGAKFLDLTATSANCTPCGGVEQTIATTAGVSYTLAFDLGSSSTYLIPSTIAATAEIVQGGLGGVQTQSFTSTATGANNWQRFSMNFVAANASTTVRLVGTFAQLDYVGLDNVSVTAAVPEPGTWALMLAGMAAVGSVASRRKPTR
jgi:Protein of unknown function (DUF642)/PEP-CTERM motif